MTQLNQSLAQRIQPAVNPMDAYTAAGLGYYGNVILSKNNDLPEEKPQVVSLIYCRLFETKEIQFGLKVLEAICQGVSAQQMVLLEEQKKFGPDGYVYVSWAETVLASPELAKDTDKLKAQHKNIETTLLEKQSK